MPRVPNGRMQLIPIGLSRPCSFWVMLRSTSRHPRIVSLAGAFHTPPDSSVRGDQAENDDNGHAEGDCEAVDARPRGLGAGELPAVHRYRYRRGLLEFEPARLDYVDHRREVDAGIEGVPDLDLRRSRVAAL